MNNTHFGAIHYDIHLDLKLDYTISRIFQEISLTELETLHQLCELERTPILQSLALEELKIPYAGFCQETDQILMTKKETYYGITLVPKHYHLYMFLKIKDAIKESQYSTKTKYILSIHFQEELIFGIQQSHVDQKVATM